MSPLRDTQVKLLAEFFANMAVVWFASAVITPAGIGSSIRATISGSIAIIVALHLVEEVKK